MLSKFSDFWMKEKAQVFKSLLLAKSRLSHHLTIMIGLCWLQEVWSCMPIHYFTPFEARLSSVCLPNFGLFGVYTYIYIRTKVGNRLGFYLNQIGSNSGRVFDKYWGPIERNVFEYMIHEFEIETLLIFLNTSWISKIDEFWNLYVKEILGCHKSDRSTKNCLIQPFLTRMWLMLIVNDSNEMTWMYRNV